MEYEESIIVCIAIVIAALAGVLILHGAGLLWIALRARIRRRKRGAALDLTRLGALRPSSPWFRR